MAQYAYWYLGGSNSCHLGVREDERASLLRSNEPLPDKGWETSRTPQKHVA